MNHINLPEACLAAQERQVLALAREVYETQTPCTVNSGPHWPWAICVKPLTDNSISVMPCGADGRPRSGKHIRERGFAAMRTELYAEADFVLRTRLGNIIQRSNLIHKKEQS